MLVSSYFFLRRLSHAELFLRVVSGNSATDGAAVVLETCAGAVAAGDGRELFSLQAGGQILNVAGGKCLGVDGDSDGSEVVLSGCDKASQWEVLGNGQLRLNAPGDLCLAQAGLAPGSADVAVNAAVMASSTVNSLSHGAFIFKALLIPLACAAIVFCACRGSDGGGR